MKKFVLAIGLLCSLCHSMELRIIHRGIIDQTINDDSALCATLSGLTAMFLTTTMTYAYCHQRNDNFDQCKNTGILASIPVGLITAGVVCGLKVRQLYERYYPRENYL